MPAAVTFDVRVVSRASRSQIVGFHDGALKIRIASPPVNGAANAELIKLLAKKFAVAKSDVSIITGETSKNKRIKINNLSQSRFDEVINEARNIVHDRHLQKRHSKTGGE